MDAAAENWGFKVGVSFHKFAGWVTWFGPTRFMQKMLTRPPILYLGNFYSFFYHDVLHWPLKESKIYKKWLVESEWGRMFQDYLDKGIWSRRITPGHTRCDAYKGAIDPSIAHVPTD